MSVVTNTVVTGVRTPTEYDDTSVAITGGTINATSVGATTPAAGKFTTLETTGNVVLGDASADTVRVNGRIGVGGAAASSAAVYVSNTALTSTTQHGVYSYLTGTSEATSQINAFNSLPATAAASFTTTIVCGYRAQDAVKGAGSTITNLYGLYVADQTKGGTNYGIYSNQLETAGSTNWNIYASGAAPNYFAGKVGINETAPDYNLDVSGTFGFTPGASVTPVDNGDVVFELTNNTTLTIKAKGSDGTVRSVALTLA